MKTKRGQILKDLRRAKGLNQSYFAELLGISLTAYQKYEHGTAEPNFDNLSKLADFYGVTTDYLLGRPDAKPPADPVEEFVDKVQMKEQEQIILKKWLALNEKQRKAVYDFMADIVHEYESESVQSNAQNPTDKIGVTYSKIYAEDGGIITRETPADLPKISDFFDD
ncbi:MAG: helix-turn-helix domain-containing protein [Ruminococcus flavefaciens]|nr:helix-turn-helix domain-containing protein [Ruminococcus flavefaciens]